MNKEVYVYLFVNGGCDVPHPRAAAHRDRGEIKNKRVRAFLHYVPYVTLAVMTFPAIMESTGSQAAGLAALVAGAALAWFGGSLFQVAVLCCAVVFAVNMLCRISAPRRGSYSSAAFALSRGSFALFMNSMKSRCIWVRPPDFL